MKIEVFINKPGYKFEGKPERYKNGFCQIQSLKKLRYKNVLLDYILCGCCLSFRFTSKSLLLTSNTGIYTPMSLCYPPNSLLLYPTFSCGFIPLRAVLSVRRGYAKLQWIETSFSTREPGFISICFKKKFQVELMQYSSHFMYQLVVKKIRSN